MKLSERLKELRKKNGKTQKEIADFSGIPVVTYRYYENGRGMPTANKLQKLADGFHVPVDYLLGKSTLNPEQELESIAGDSWADLTSDQRAILIAEIEQFKKLNKKG